jgi:hypothetical protein
MAGQIRVVGRVEGRSLRRESVYEHIVRGFGGSRYRRARSSRDLRVIRFETLVDRLNGVVNSGLDHCNVENAGWAWALRTSCYHRLQGDGIPIAHGVSADAGRCCKDEGNDGERCAGLKFQFHNVPFLWFEWWSV